VWRDEMLDTLVADVSFLIALLNFIVSIWKNSVYDFLLNIFTA
jgi:hypothetical protein